MCLEILDICENCICCNPKAVEKNNPPTLDKKGWGGNMQQGETSNQQKPAFMCYLLKGGKKKPYTTRTFLFSYFAMQRSCLGPKNTVACKILYALMTAEIHGFIYINKDDHVYCKYRLCCSGPTVFNHGNKNKTNIVHSICPFVTEQTQTKGSQCCSFQFLGWPEGTCIQKRVPAEPASAQRPYCAHGMIHWICGGAEAYRPQCHIKKRCNCRADELLISQPRPQLQRRGLKWDNFTSSPHRKN